MPAFMISLLISTSFAELEEERKRGGRGVTKRVDVLLHQKKILPYKERERWWRNSNAGCVFVSFYPLLLIERMYETQQMRC